MIQTSTTLGALKSSEFATTAIATGVLTITSVYTIAQAETSTTDDIDTITPNLEGITSTDVYLVMIEADSGDTITVKHGTGNITLQSTVDVILTGGQRLLLFGDATNGFTDFATSANNTNTAQLTLTAAASVSPTTNGAASGTIETATYAVLIPTKDFDAATDEYIQWAIPMPSVWDAGTITASFHWSATGGMAAETVDWGLQAVALANDDALDTDFGTAVTVTDTWIANGDLHISGDTAAITIANTPTAGDLVVFRVFRDTSEDDLTGDAQLIAVNITFGLV